MVSKGHDQAQEVKRRIEQGWSVFCKLDNIMRYKNVSMRLKRKACNKRILPVMTHASTTYISDCKRVPLPLPLPLQHGSSATPNLRNQSQPKRKMERSMAGVLKDRKSTN